MSRVDRTSRRHNREPWLATALIVAVLTLAASATIAGADQAGEELAARGSRHWAFQPLSQSTQTADGAESLSETIDRLLTTRREAAGVSPVRLADRRTLIRRVTFHLTGLPPAPAEVEAFVADRSPDALANVVERLLATPEFGERWGRHWLDIARYADSNGCSIEANNTYDNAWRYRDYVISSLNNDKPIDRFITEQVAGDLLEATTDYERSELLIATGFLQLGPKAFGTGSFEQLRFDVIDDQIDTIGKSLLGLSLGCARCHDHKLEPVTIDDYYALAGVFSSTSSIIQQAGWRSSKTWRREPLPVLDAEAEATLRQRHEQRLKDARSGELTRRAEEELKQAAAHLAALREQEGAATEEIEAAEAAVERAKFTKRNAERLAKVLPVVSPVPAAMAVADVEQPRDEQVRFGGDPGVKGDVVPRSVPRLPGMENRDNFAIGPDASGRLELARWLVDVDHGAGRLSARVFVNRVWRHLFGEGIVPTVDNFGLSGQAPAHPELLDELSTRFIGGGWSVKRLIRGIVLSDAYQLSGADDPAAAAADPENRLLWRRTPQRLEAEAIRDAVLAISGELDPTRGGKTLQHLGLVTIRSDMIDLDTPSPYARRSVYLPVIRDALGVSREVDSATVLMTAFDAASPNLVCGDRGVSIVPAQALFLMNSPFVADNARRVAQRMLEDERLSDDRARIDELFRWAYARPATDAEAAGAVELIDSLASDAKDSDLAAWSGLCHAVLSSNEFLFLK